MEPGKAPEVKPEVKIVETVEASRTRLYDTYADLTARVWCNVQPGQPVLIVAERCHEELAKLIGEKAHTISGAKVDYYFEEPQVQKARILSDEPIESLKVPNEALNKISKKLVEEQGAFIKIVGQEDPLALESLDEIRRKAVRDAQSLALKPSQDAIMAGLLNRCVIAAPTYGWATAVRPDLDREAAFRFLEDSIFKMTYVDQPNPLEGFMALDEQLEEKRKILQELDIETLRFHGPGLNLTVGLSDKAIWLGGRKETVDERKIRFYANVPIGEIFTTPDWRTVNGMATLTQPLYVENDVVEGAVFTFKDGVIVDFSATKGQKALEAFFNAHEGKNRRLGEIALVSLDSPVAQLALITKEILLDEKAASHFAAGKGYLVCIRDGAKLTDEQKTEIGFNDTLNHLDFMISNRETTVTAITRSGKEVVIQQNGLWVI